MPGRHSPSSIPIGGFGFDIFRAWRDVFPMTLMFFLSGVFAGRASTDGEPVSWRFMRLVVPFHFGVDSLVVPTALYPAYFGTGVNPAPYGIRERLSPPALLAARAPLVPVDPARTHAGCGGLASFCAEGVRILLGKVSAFFYRGRRSCLPPGRSLPPCPTRRARSGWASHPLETRREQASAKLL